MHTHICSRCRDRFVCPDSIIDCFRGEIVCDACFWKHDFKQFLAVLMLAFAALTMTVFLFIEAQK